MKITNIVAYYSIFHVLRKTKDINDIYMFIS